MGGQRKYPDLLCLPPVYSLGSRNRRRQARTWLSTQSKKYKLVKGEFQKLGYSTLEKVCEQQGGFVINDQADSRENKGFEILENIIKELYSGFFLKDYVLFISPTLQNCKISKENVSKRNSETFSFLLCCFTESRERIDKEMILWQY